MLPIPTFIPRRYRPGALANWSGHLAFANDLIAHHRPSMLVELGTHYGESYFGMCQSVVTNGLDCVCYAVDHWHGEEHAGFYGEEVFTEVEEYNRRSYKSFSYLLRSSFDDALTQFADESIGLLHIDGLHTYEAISHDFHSWFKKVKPGGIVFLHDVRVRHANFGIWKLWQELQAEFPDTFTFNHSWGLGVLRKPDNGADLAGFLDFLFHSSSETNEQIRRHYVLYASYLETLLASGDQPKLPVAAPRASPSVAKTGPLLMQLFLHTPGGYSEAASFVQQFEPGNAETLQFSLPTGVSGCLRLDPVDRPCIFELTSISLLEPSSGNPIWSANTPDAIRALDLSESASFLPRADACFILSHGDDPYLSLPLLDHQGPLLLEVSIRVELDSNLLSDALAQVKPNAASAHLDRPYAGIELQVFPFNPSGYSQSEAQSASVDIGRWNTLTFDLAAGSCLGPIRLDPADAPCLVEIGALEILDRSNGSNVLDLRDREQLRTLVVLDDAVYVPLAERYTLFCYGHDPKLQITQQVPFSGASRLVLSVRVETDFKPLAAILAQKDLSEVAGERDKIAQDLAVVKTELTAAQSSRLLLAAELSHLATEKNSAQRDLAIALSKQQSLAARQEAADAAASSRIAVLEEQSRKVASELTKKAADLSELQAALAAERAVISSVIRSLSWRVTRPLRAAMMLLRGRPRGGQQP